jgi:Fic family protein
LAFLYTETDGNDTTYFVVHQLDVIQKAKERLHTYIDRISAEVSETERLLQNCSDSLNHRPLALISHAWHTYTVEGQQRSHGAVYETARAISCISLSKAC